MDISFITWTCLQNAGEVADPGSQTRHSELLVVQYTLWIFVARWVQPSHRSTISIEFLLTNALTQNEIISILVRTECASSGAESWKKNRAWWDWNQCPSGIVSISYLLHHRATEVLHTQYHGIFPCNMIPYSARRTGGGENCA